jgi:hypothetical protein
MSGETRRSKPSRRGTQLQGTPLIFGSGTTRGDLLEARFDFTFDARLRGHVLYERFLPGSFYAGHTPGYLVRIEFLAAFQHRW